MSNTCYSGGADGADLVWGNIAKEHGHRVTHFSFNGHRTRANPEDVIRLDEKQLLAADPYLTQAIINLKRARLEKRTEFVKSLLRRNWWQVRDATACYAVSHLHKGVVAGGTGYAVQMFIDRGLMSMNSGPWIFDQEQLKWFRWNRSWARWEATNEVPPPTDRYAGIGTREINRAGIAAVEDVYSQ